MIINVAQIVPVTEAEGPGRRFALWFQGCPLRCPGCCNPEMLPFAGGTAMPHEEILLQLDQAMSRGIEGITLLGGEPVAHAEAAARLAHETKARGLSVMVFSGYTLEEIQQRPEPVVHELLACTDILVDGPFRAELPEAKRRWIGSANQRIHFLSSRYAADDPCWQRPNTLEIRLAHNEVAINGFPARSAVGLWKRLSSNAGGRP
jgi:anaerobic ribonucleoside-triphosphate reductase activating protein